ncbi:Mediator of RNA polymerase II transcription subunit 16, partial [Neophaeococcomyces mojaviensis]
MDQSMDSTAGNDIDVNAFDDVFADGNNANLADGIEGAGLGLGTGLTDPDPTNPNLILQPSPLITTSAAQIQQIGDFSFHGSLSRIAWSRQGHVTRIIENGTAVEITGQRFDPKSSKWVEITPYRLPLTFEDAVALSWSINGFELAIVDARGRVHIFTLTPTSLNRLICFRDGNTGQGDVNETSRPVGVYWLSQYRNPNDKRKTILESRKVDGKWKNETVESNAYPPYLVRALCTVSRSGTFSVFFVPPEIGAYRETSISLPIRRSAILTHAAMGQTPTGRILVAVHDTEGTVSTYHVDVAFVPNEPLPSLSVEVIDEHISSTPPYFESQDLPDSMSRWMLTHLQVFPEFEYNIEHLPHKPPKQPISVLAVYTSVNTQVSATNPSFFWSSVIKKWQLVQAQYDLHPLFGEGDGSSPAQLILQPLNDTRLAGTLSSMQVLDPGNALAITTLDGTTTFWDPDTMMPLPSSTSSNPITVTSTGQTSLAYPMLEMSVEQCISPQAVVMAMIDSSDKLQFVKDKHQDVAQMRDRMRDLDPQNADDEALIAGLILAFSRSCWTSSNFDDIVSSIQNTFTTPSLIVIRRQIYHTLFQAKMMVPGPSDLSDLEKVSQSPIVHKAITFHLGLFRLHSLDSQRADKLSYLWAWMVVNIRFSVTILTETWKAVMLPPAQVQKMPPISLGFLDTVGRNVEWMFNVLNFIFHTVLEVGDRNTHPHMFKHSSAAFESMLGDESANGTQGLVALLLNCNWSRAFLMTFAKLCRAFTTRAKMKPVTFGILTDEERKEQRKMDEAIEGTPNGRIAERIQNSVLRHGISINAIETLTDSRWFPDSWRDEASNNATLERQVEMMITGIVSEQYQGSIQNILDNCLNGDNGLRARCEIDRLKLLEEMPDRS